MQILMPSSELIMETDPFRKIEMAGRTCYKSQDKITETSARDFYTKMVKSGHHAMLEHAAFVFEVEEKLYSNLLGMSPFLHMTQYHNGYMGVKDRYLVSGNLRALNEAPFTGDLLVKLMDIDPILSYQHDPRLLTLWGLEARVVSAEEVNTLTVEERKAHTYPMFRFITDRGVTHEIVRHRPASYAQESTRYCNYAKDSEIQFILPSFLHDNVYKPDGKPWNVNEYDKKFGLWQTLMRESEVAYLDMIELGCSPQEARSVLPNSLKTEIIMSANGEEFDHFFNLRSLGLTGKPHPDMKYLADRAFEQYNTEVFPV